MIRQKALKQHIRRHHPSYYQEYIQNGPRVGSAELRRQRKRGGKQ